MRDEYGNEETQSECDPSSIANENYEGMDYEETGK